jgi:ABC-type dipeptide/oligopeptide/nickel transport system permease component
MIAYTFRRLLSIPPTIWAVVTITFLILHVLPGDPSQEIQGLLATPQQIQAQREALGLHLPITTQYANFIGEVAQGDLGDSFTSGQPVTAEILARLPQTLKLAVVATVLAIVVGVVAGVLAAARRNSLADLVISALAALGVSMPVFWLGLLLIMLFAIKLHLLPAAGSEGPLAIVLPAVTLAAPATALITRQTRSAVLETIGQDYVRTARAKGAGPGRVLFRHAFRNSLLPVITITGLQFGSLLGGVVLTESVFGWPGIGRLLVDSILARDYPVVQGVVLMFAGMFLVLNLIVDLAYSVADPRIRYS